MEDEQDIFDASFEGAEAPEPKAEPVTETPQEPAPTSEPEPPVAEQPDSGTITVPIKPDPGFVPFGAVLDERDKRKKLEAEVEELRKQRQEPPQPTQLPDQFDDDFVPALTKQFEDRLYQQSYQMSERFARNQYGDEATEAALKWAFARCDSDPYFNAQVRASGDPVGHAVREYQRDQIVQSVTPDDFKQFTAWRQAQAGLQQQPSAQPNPPPQAPPPKSLASAPSAGSILTEPVPTDEEVFEETFARK